MADFSQLSLAQLVKRLFKNARSYGIGIVLLRASNILIIPILWFRLEPSDFGIIALFQIVINLLAPILDMGTQSSVNRLFYDWSDEKRPYHIGALYTFTLLCSFTVCLTLDFIGSQFAEHFITSIDFHPYLRLAIWTAFFTNFSLIPLVILRCKEEIHTFTSINILHLILQTSFVLFFIFYMDLSALGYILGFFISAALMAVFHLVRLARIAKINLRVENLRSPLKYGLPLIPAAVIEGINGTLDRIVLEKFATLSTLGIYNLARQFGVLQNIVQQIMKSSWIPLVYRVDSTREDSSEVISRMTAFYLTVLLLSGISISVLAPDVIRLFGVEKYYGVVDYLPLFVLGFAILGFGHIYGRGIDLAKKTQYYMLIYSVSLTANLISLYLLVPKYQAWGAAFSFIIAQAAREVVQIGLSLKFYKQPINILKTGFLFVSAGIAYFAIANIHITNIFASFATKSLALLFTAVFLVFFTFGPSKSMELIRRFKSKV